MTDEERSMWMSTRQALLMQVDAIERLLRISPRTSELKKQGRDRLQEVRQDLERNGKAAG